MSQRNTTFRPARLPAPVARRNPLLGAGIAATTLLGACYHATVHTGIQPGPQRIEQKWAKSYAGGLVPVDPLTADCGANGVATVETRLSFMNQVVSAITFGIVTPMEIVITCGAGRGEGEAAEDGGPAGPAEDARPTEGGAAADGGSAAKPEPKSTKR